jgi:hypothetical protein
MPVPRLKLVQGMSRDFPVQTPNGDGTVGSEFVSSDAIFAKVWAGDSEAALATPSCVWGTSSVTPAAGAPLTLWTIQFNGSDTSSLSPGLYRCQVFATHGSRTACLLDGLLELIDTAATSTDGDLVSFTYVETLLAPLRLKGTEREMIWLLKTEASDAIRKYCGQRDFTRKTYTEEYVAELNGWVALRQMPVNNVTRIRGYKQTVLSITAAPSVNQQAWVTMTTSGDWYTNTLVYTGITLNAVSNGTLTTNSFLFANNPTVASLAAAVAATPSWSALTTPVFGLYPSTDLSPPGGLTAQGAMDDDGCELQAYTEDLTCCKLQNNTGFLWCGRHRVASSFGQRWGEDWELLEDADGPIGQIQVTYDAGFTIVPTPVQLACAELVGQRIMRLRKDLRLKREDNGVYKYEISDKDIADLPYAMRCALGKWKMMRAS